MWGVGTGSEAGGLAEDFLTFGGTHTPPSGKTKAVVVDEVIQGRRLAPGELGEIRELLCAHPDWHRTRVSRELCQRWDWRTETGRPKDMACRSLLLKLEARGWIQLPPRRSASVNGRRNLRPVEVDLDRSVLEADLGSLQPLRIDLIGPGSHESALFRGLLQQHHYLGLRNRVGENLGYLVWSRTGRPVAALLFGSAAWHCQPRDAFIGWNEEQRHQHRSRLTNNTRFLIPHWVRVPHLASHVLARVIGRLNGDWLDRYGHGIELVETFVEPARFAGTAYRAAGWRPVGRTTGRGRNGPSDVPSTTAKEVFVRPLGRHWRRRLCS